MNYSSTRRKLETAMAETLAEVAADLDLPIRKGLETQEAKGDAIIVITEDSEAIDPAVANEMITLAVKVSSQMDDTTPDQHQERCKQVGDVVLGDDMEYTLTSKIIEFEVLWVGFAGTDEVYEDRRFLTTFNLRCHCAPSDMSE